MPTASLVVMPATARRFMRRALLLDEPALDITTALGHHGCIQIEPTNVRPVATDLRLCRVYGPKQKHEAGDI